MINSFTAGDTGEWHQSPTAEDRKPTDSDEYVLTGQAAAMSVNFRANTERQHNYEDHKRGQTDMDSARGYLP
jgi:hypothetical protein